MGAIVKACNIVNTPKNTGKECDTSMVATSMVIAIRPDITFDDTDLEDPVSWLTTLIHEKKAFPLFGLKAPIREITNEAESDQIVTLDDGLKVFLRYGLYNRSFATTSGGLCYAEALQSFLNSGYSVIEIDQIGQLLARDNGDDTYSGIITDFMFSPTPIMADFKSTPFKSKFNYSYSPIELVTNGIIFKGASALLSMMGLIDAMITKAAAATTTILKIGVETTCAHTDLVAKFGNDLGTHTNNFRVENLASLGTPVALTSASIVGGHIELVGVFTTANTFRVWGAAPTGWLANNVEGYDGSVNYVDILIP